MENTNKPSFSVSNESVSLKGQKQVVTLADYKSSNLRISYPVKFTHPTKKNLTFYRIFIKYFNEETQKEGPLILGSDSPLNFWSWGLSVPKNDGNDANDNHDAADANDSISVAGTNAAAGGQAGASRDVVMNIFFIPKEKEAEADATILKAQQDFRLLHEKIRNDICDFILEHMLPHIKKVAGPIEITKNWSPLFKDIKFKNSLEVSENLSNGDRLKPKMFRGGEKTNYEYFTRFYNSNNEILRPEEFMYQTNCIVDPILWFDNLFFNLDKFIPQMKILEATVEKLEYSKQNTRLSRSVQNKTVNTAGSAAAAGGDHMDVV